MKSLSGEDQKEEWAMIEAGFNDFEEEVILLLELNKKGYEDEALLLCCCYIEALGNLYFRDGGRGYNFYRILKDYGGEDVLMHIHPKQLWIGLRSARRKDVQEIGQKIGGALKNVKENLYTKDEALTLVAHMLNKKEMKKLRDNLWRGTLAALAYMHLRNPAVHELGGTKSFSFQGTTFKGALDFSLLYKGMLNIFKKLREISIETRTYFGQDFDSLLDSYLAIHREWGKLGREKRRG